MKIYIGIRNYVSEKDCYTSLSAISEKLGVSYDSALKGKRMWLLGDDFVEIKELELHKIRGRGSFGK